MCACETFENMTSTSIPYRSFATEYGTFIGINWALLFLTYVGGIANNNALLILLCFALFGIAVVMPFVLAMRLNRKAFIVGERLSYLQGLFFSFSMLMYACLFNGLVVYAYFQYLDDGALMAQVNNMVTQPDIVTTYRQMGMGEQYDQMLSMMGDIEALSAWEKTLMVFNNNFFVSVVLSLLVAIVASYDLRKLHPQQPKN